MLTSTWLGPKHEYGKEDGRPPGDQSDDSGDRRLPPAVRRGLDQRSNVVLETEQCGRGLRDNKADQRLQR